METLSVSFLKRSVALLCGFPFFISMLYMFSFSGWAEENTLIPTVTVSDATTANFQLSLNEKATFRVIPTTGGAVLIKATQSVANVRLALYGDEYKTSEPLLTLDIPAAYRQPEYLLFDANDCVICYVEIDTSASSPTQGRSDILFSAIGTGLDARKNFYNAIQLASLTWSAAENQLAEMEYKEALHDVRSHYEKAENIATSLEDHSLIVFSAYMQSIVSHYLGEYDNQADLLKRILQQTSIPQSYLIKVNMDLASYYIYEEGEFDTAVAYLSIVFDHLNSGHYPLLYAEAKELEASIEIEIGSYLNAVAAFEETSKIFLEQGDVSNAIKSMTSLGWLFYHTGDFNNAMQQYVLAKKLATQISDNYAITNLHIKLSGVYRQLGNIEQANHHVTQALKLSGRFKHAYLDAWANVEKAKLLQATGQYIYSKDTFDIAKRRFFELNASKGASEIDFFVGLLNMQLGEHQQAKERIESYLFNTDGIATDYEHAIAASNLAHALTLLGNKDEAMKYQENALNVLMQTQDIRSIGLAQIQMATLHASMGNFENAETYFNKGTSKLIQTRSTLSQLDSTYAYANEIAQIKPVLALQIGRDISEQIDAIFSEIKRTDLRRGYFSTYQKVVSLLIRVDNSLSAEQSLLLAEAARSRTIGYGLYRDNSTNNDIQREQKKLNQKQQVKLIELSTQIETQQRKQTIREIRALSEALYQLESDNYVVPQSTAKFSAKSLAQLQQSLTEHDMVLFIDTAEVESRLWFIDQQQIVSFKSEHERFFSERVGAVLNVISQKLPLRKMRKEVAELRNTLFPSNAESLFKGKTNLIVIPDGALTRLPFSLLPASSPAQSGWSVSYQHSLKNIVDSRRDNYATAVDEGSILVVADPLMKTMPKDQSSPLGYGFQSSSLPYTAKEASYINEFSAQPITLLNKGKASKQALAELDLSTFNIVHMATHGLANNQVPELGGLVLSNDSSADNLLFASEIRRLRLKAQLVVLSGCETTQGHLIEGEGMLGLTRAFIEAGAHSVIGSLWQVQDDATAMLMKEFYRYLLQHELPISEALEKAKVAVKNHKRKNGTHPWRSPYYWAGFVLHGNAA
ncbi:hypothetical protein A6K25_08365 [Alteromonas stellipolaris]|uniref:CHAT domain-containing protein n=2 Tax=Alteromonas stellipolaris TaxID=233316 RepID=A0ABM5YM08_9ALTE|nr:hypothetical protein AVL57_17375 [Alteromonas stellipolaris]AMJ88003.1 hypothetical protein AV939_16315 [Alteromonas sp. Mac1]ANB21285.1 hypothetical protein A6K25_08365 [Alteromonas stellipolaris]